jgi:hypothetical protein
MIAQTLGLSELTIYQALKVLEAAHLIQRLPQEMKTCKFSVAHICLRPALCWQLGLIPQQVTCRGVQSCPIPSVILLSVKWKPLLDNLPLEDQTLSKETVSSLPSRKIAHCCVLSELAWLIKENHLDICSCFQLMKLARQVGYWLSDEIQAAVA